MIRPVGRRRWAVLALATISVGCAAGRGRASVVAPPAVAPSRAILLAPDAAFWREQAPPTVRVRVETTRGPFTLELTRALAPIGVDHFYNLVRAGYYDDSRFHRTVAGWITQFGVAGDPAVTATWATRPIRDDPVRASNVRGSVTFAMTAPVTRTTQIAISRRDNLSMDTQGFAPLGRVVEGMDVVDSLYSGYGEQSGGGMRAGHQQRLLAEGNAWLDREFPLLDHLIRATVVPASGIAPPR